MGTFHERKIVSYKCPITRPWIGSEKVSWSDAVKLMTYRTVMSCTGNFQGNSHKINSWELPVSNQKLFGNFPDSTEYFPGNLHKNKLLGLSTASIYNILIKKR